MLRALYTRLSSIYISSKKSSQLNYEHRDFIRHLSASINTSNLSHILMMIEVVYLGHRSPIQTSVTYHSSTIIMPSLADSDLIAPNDCVVENKRRAG